MNLPNVSRPENSTKIDEFIEMAVANFRPEITVAQAREKVRALSDGFFFTYVYVTDAAGKFLGVVTMRDLLLNEDSRPIGSFMLRAPFYFTSGMKLMDAMRATVTRHFPTYPVCDQDGVLLGIVQGSDLFAQQSIEITAQAGSMVGVSKEETTSGSWFQSLKFRHPWLQINLVTTFLAAAVVGAFEDTINHVVALAIFLPVMMSQSANTGCQALAVALRGITLGELKPGKEKGLIAKEAWVGLLNGALTGLTAGLGMFAYATWKHTAHSPALLGLVVLTAMTGSCVVSGVCGALTPIILKKLGTDPAAASSIFLTTVTDVVSMGLFLCLAAFWII